jgi:translocation and assembly module TamB
LADPLRYQIREGRVQNLDVAALAGDTTRSSITGTFRLDGSGTTPQGDLRLDVAGLQLTDSYYGPYVINATNLDAAVAGGRVALDGQADLEGGSFALSNAVVYPFAATPSFSVGSASFQDVDIGRLGQYRGGDVEQSSSLNGSVTLDGQGLDPQTMSLAGTARLDSSRLNRQAIQSATVEITLSDGRLAYDGTLEVPEGQTRIAGTVRPFAEDPTFAVTSGTFSGIDVGALAGIEGLDTNLQGEIQSLEGEGFSLEEFRGDARVDLTGSRINDATVARGTLDLDASEGVTDLAADLRFEGGGRADVQARLDQTGGGLSYRAEGTLDSLSAGRLLGDGTRAGPLSLSLDVRGQGTDPRTATSQGRIRLTGGRLAGIRAQHLLLDYNLNEGLLVVDTLAVRSNVADATGGGPLALYDPGQRYASDFRFTASVDSLAPVRPLLGDSLAALAVGRNRFQGRLAGQPGGPLRLQSDVNAAGLVYGDTRVASFDGAVRATATARDSTGAGGLLPAAQALAARGVEALRNAQVRGETGYLSSGQASVRRVDVNAIYGGKNIDLRLRAKVDPERDIQLAGVVDPRPEAQRVRLDTLNVRFGPDRWKLLQDATISYGEKYRVSGLLLFTEGGQQIAADGVVDFDGRQSLVVTIEAFRIGAVADLFGYDGLEGALGGTLTLSGPAQRPELEGTLDADIVSEGERTGDVRVALDYANQRLGVDATLENRDQSTLTAQGYLPLNLRLANPDDLADVSIPDSAAVGPAPPADTVAIGEEGSPVEITGIDAATLGPEEVAFAVRADAFALTWVRPFLDREQVEDLGGRLTADVDVGGTLGAPELRGTATLASGTFDLATIGTAYQDVRAQLRFTDDRVQVERAVVEAGGGRLTIGGTVDLRELTLGQLDLTAEASNFRVVETDEYRATASGDLRLQGTTQAPVLRGDLTVRDADLDLDALRGEESNYAEVTLGEQDLRALRENFGVRVTEADTTRSQAYQALAMNLDVEIERDTWLRSTANPELDVQLEGDIDLRKDAQEDLQLFGSIEVVPERSRVVQFGKRFEIASGVVTFNGNPANPSIDLEAEYNVQARQSRGNEVTITLAVRGRPDDLNFELGSSTPMSTTDIFSYIATGQPAGARTGAGAGGATSLATGAAFGQISNLVEGIAGAQGVGLDVIEIQTDPQRGTVLTAGEYIYSGVLPNPFFVAVSQPLGAATGDAGDAGIQTEVTIQYEVTEGFLVRLLRRESIRLNLRYEYAY